MKILRFTLKGNFAHFRNPEINNNINLTFHQIHKVALKGIIGAIIGLDGYNTAKLTKKPVEFLEKLKNLKVGIIPKVKRGVFDKQIIEYVNSTGFASSETGGVLMVREQVLINPCWEIFLDLSNLQDDISRKIEDYILNSKAEFLYYLGRNNYFGEIENPTIIDCNTIDKPNYISSLFDKSNIIFIDDDSSLAYDDYGFYNSFFLPWDIDKVSGYQKYYKNLYLTNYYIEKIQNNTDRLFIKDQDKIIELL